MRLLPLLLALWAGPALANMASPVEPGTPIGEPVVALDGLRVAREALTLDLSPLGRGRPFATVEAAYLIVNEGPARTLPLEFLALGDDVDAAAVWLDERPVAAERVTLDVPPAWTAATQTPALGGAPVPYAADDGVGTPSGLRFTLSIPSGTHLVRVRYRVRAGSYDAGDHPNRVRQLAYALAPARLWAGFDRLDVEVLVPEGWEAAASLPLRREGDRLVGRFDGVPGDLLTLSVRAPIPSFRTPLRVGAGLAALLVAGFVGWLAGLWVGRAGRPARRALPASILAGVLAAAALVIGIGAADGLGDSSAYGYGAALGLLYVAAPLAVVAGTALAQTVAVVTARRVGPAPSVERHRPRPEA